MKRRTSPCSSPSRPLRVPCSLASVCPAALKMSNLDGFRLLFGGWQKSLADGVSRNDSDALETLLLEFLSLRDLTFEPNDEKYLGCDVFLLSRRGSVIGSFSVQGV